MRDSDRGRGGRKIRITLKRKDEDKKAYEVKLRKWRSNKLNGKISGKERKTG